MPVHYTGLLMRYRHTIGILLLCVLGCSRVAAQDVEPRRWTPLPVGVNVVGVGYGFTTGHIFLDPVLQLEDGEVDLHTAAVSYVRSFSLWGRYARIEVLLPWHSAEWKGLLEGLPARATRVGHGDPIVRLSWNLVGTPAMDPGEFREFVTSNPVNTVVGAAIAVTVPVGENFEDKLLNLGQNRWIIRPQIGVVHTRRAWSYELTASTFLYEDNDDFFDGNELEQDPLYAIQTHVIRFFRPGFWASVSAAYGWEGGIKVDGVTREEEKDLVLAALSFGFPVAKKQGLKLGYIRSETRENTGSDTNSLAIAWSMRF
jgi:hypothetical protein